jgi:NDP-mannose synthase
MIAVILAGGKGTRLAPYNTIFPKPLVPLGERPILDIIMHQLTHYGFDRIVLSVGYLAELIEAYFTSGAPRPYKADITFVREKEPLGTVGALSLVKGLTEPFLVMNGDVLTTLNYAKLMEYHKAHGADLTIAMHRRKTPLDIGIMDVNERNELLRFQEKPTLEHLVSMGVYVYNPEILRYIQPGKHLDFPDVVWKMLDEDHRIVGYPSDDYWMDLGSHADYHKAQNAYEELKDKLLPNGEQP